MKARFATISCMSIGSRIKQAREAKDMSQDALAAAVGVSRPAVSQWEDGTSEPRNKKLPKISEALGVTPAWLLHGSQGGGSMPVKGEVAAGLWREAIDLEFDPIPVSPVENYPADAQYALLVRGNSLNRIAADSEYLVVVDTLFSGVSPRPGDVVVVQRRRHGMTEATVKRLVKTGQTIVLRAESTDLQHQGTITLEETGDDTEIVISAIVLGKYSAIPRGPM